MRKRPNGVVYPGFEAWLDRVLRGALPAEVTAFVFNLYEHDDSFAVQLAGCAEFDEENEEWAVNDIFSTGDDLFEIPRIAVGDDWEAALAAAKMIITKYLAEGAEASRLKKSRAVAVGFVDGDLEVIHSDA